MFLASCLFSPLSSFFSLPSCLFYRLSYLTLSRPLFALLSVIFSFVFSNELWGPLFISISAPVGNYLLLSLMGALEWSWYPLGAPWGVLAVLKGARGVIWGAPGELL